MQKGGKIDNLHTCVPQRLAEETRDENEMKECSFYDIINECKLYINYSYMVRCLSKHFHEEPASGDRSGIAENLGDGRELVGGRHVAHKPVN